MGIFNEKNCDLIEVRFEVNTSHESLKTHDHQNRKYILFCFRNKIFVGFWLFTFKIRKNKQNLKAFSNIIIDKNIFPKYINIFKNIIVYTYEFFK